jgi:ribosome-binding factor A
MMIKSKVSDIKREQRKSFYLRELSQLLYIVAQDVPFLLSVFLTRVDLSADGGICYLYFSASPTPELDTPEKVFELALPKLKLYKPSLRTALAKSSSKRYVPDLFFLFDEKKEKVDKMNELLNKVQEDLNP